MLDAREPGHPVARQPLYRAALRLLAAYPAALYPFLLFFPHPGGARVAAWSAAYLAFLLLVSPPVRARIRSAAAAGTALAAAAALALTMAGLLGSGLEGALLALVATEVATLTSTRVAIGVSVALTVLGTASLAIPREAAVALDVGAAWLALVLVATCLARVAASEVEARRALAGALGRLAERSRATERTRIARELHDLLGHRLVGLGLQLEIASHLDPSAGREPVERARRAAQQLLEDVRHVVHALDVRERPPLAAALRALIAELPALAVELEVADELEAPDPLRHDLLVGAARELLTNAARHAGTRSVRLTARALPGGVEVAAADEGCGSPDPAPTGGLRFLRDRLELVGGSLEIRTAPGAGFRARAWVPRPAALEAT